MVRCPLYECLMQAACCVCFQDPAVLSIGRLYLPLNDPNVKVPAELKVRRDLTRTIVPLDADGLICCGRRLRMLNPLTCALARISSSEGILRSSPLRPAMRLP